MSSTADAPSRPRNDGQRGSRGRGRGRGRGGAGGGGLGEAGNDSRSSENRGGRRGGRGGNRGGSASLETTNTNANAMNSTDLSSKFSTQKKLPKADGETKNVDGELVEAEVCFICASDVEHHAVAPCNHRTCHICALRMRALYKTKDCVHCRVSSTLVKITKPS